MGRLLGPVVGDGEVGTRPGFRVRADGAENLSLPPTPIDRRRPKLDCYRTLPTATVGARSSRIDTHSPESVSDCRFR